MRLSFSLKIDTATSIPINYQYPLMSSIFYLLKSASEEYTEFLHNEGYRGLDGKKRKLFTFSKLQLNHKVEIRKNYFYLLMYINNNKFFFFYKEYFFL